MPDSRAWLGVWGAGECPPALGTHVGARGGAWATRPVVRLPTTPARPALSRARHPPTAPPAAMLPRCPRPSQLCSAPQHRRHHVLEDAIKEFSGVADQGNMSKDTKSSLEAVLSGTLKYVHPTYFPQRPPLSPHARRRRQSAVQRGGTFVSNSLDPRQFVQRAILVKLSNVALWIRGSADPCFHDALTAQAPDWRLEPRANSTLPRAKSSRLRGVGQLFSKAQNRIMTAHTSASRTHSNPPIFGNEPTPSQLHLPPSQLHPSPSGEACGDQIDAR